jgi:arylsulfatase A-like enzyme
MSCGLLYLVFAGFCAQATSAPQVRPPNILWIIAEDIGLDLGCYGEPLARTPNLDRLAAEGRIYRHAYSTAPVCSASRSAFITGMWQTAIGAHHHRSHRTDGYQLPSGVETIMDRLRRAGYFTANIRSFPPGTPFRGGGKTDWNFQVAGKPFDSDRWSDLKAHQPFFAQVNFFETHRVYQKAKTNATDPAKVRLPPYLPDHPVAREDWARYLDNVAALDEKTGAVLNLLEREGLRDNTVVFWFGDNGRDDFRGKFYAYEQGCAVPLIVRWPGRVPTGSVNEELVSLIDVTATTLFAAGLPIPRRMHGRLLLGPEARPREFLFTARDRIDETLDRVRTVRDGRFKYIRNYEPDRPYYQTFRYIEFEEYNPLNALMKRLHAVGKLTPEQDRMFAERRPREELYDLDADPFEFQNLAAAPEHSAMLKRLRAALDRWIKETGDQGAIPEDPATRTAELRTYQEAVKKLEQRWKQ